jgi:hypothetical protein
MDAAKRGSFIVASAIGVSPPQIVLESLAFGALELAFRGLMAMLAPRPGLARGSVGLANMLLVEKFGATRRFGTEPVF